MAMWVMIPSNSVNAANAKPEVIPAIQNWIGGSGNFTITESTRICVDPNFSNDLTSTANTFKDELKILTDFTLNVVTTDSPEDGDIYLTLSANDTSLGEEGYNVIIDNYVTIKSNRLISHDVFHDAGVFYGTRTVLQILKQDADHINLPKGTIKDWPSVKFRGHMNDIGRMYHSIPLLEKQIKQLSWYKLNVFHFHLTELNAFRLESTTYPGLATAGESYTKDEMRALQDLAKKYHVMIIPEIDIPGHAGGIIQYRPEYEDPCFVNMALKSVSLVNEEARTFMKNLLDEFVPFFDAPYFHIGTDEWPDWAGQGTLNHWADNCPHLTAYAQAKGFPKNADVYVDWINETDDQIKSYGKRTIIWDWYEQFNTTIPLNTSVVIDSWMNFDVTGHLAAGRDVINSSGNKCYFPNPGMVGMYDTWAPNIFDRTTIDINHPHFLGAKTEMWCDWYLRNSSIYNEEFFSALTRSYLPISAESIWGNNKSGSLVDFAHKVNVIGNPPGVTPQICVNNKIMGTNNNQFEYIGNWAHGGGSRSPYMGDDSWSATTNDVYKVRFYGTQIKIFNALSSNHGKYAVSIDGGEETIVDTYNSYRIDMVNTYTSPVLTNGQHTLSVRVTGEKNPSSSSPCINADYVEIIGELGTSTSTPTPVFQDDFNNGNLNEWTSVSGTWTNPGTVAQGATEAATNGFFMKNTNTGSDFTYEADIKLDTVNSAAFLIFRSNDDGSYSYCVALDSWSNVVKLYKFPYVSLESYNYTFSTNTWYHLKIVTKGSNIKVYFNNSPTPCIDFNDSTYSQGMFGIGSYNGTIQIDNINAY
jgi:hexosaminidase